MMQMSDDEHPDVSTVNEAIEHMVSIGHIGPGGGDVDEPNSPESAVPTTDGGNPALEGPSGADPPSSSSTVELPCGHEEVDLEGEELKPILEEHGSVNVSCDECGGTWNLSP